MRLLQSLTALGVVGLAHSQTNTTFNVGDIDSSTRCTYDPPVQLH